MKWGGESFEPVTPALELVQLMNIQRVDLKLLFAFAF